MNDVENDFQKINTRVYTNQQTSKIRIYLNNRENKGQ